MPYYFFLLTTFFCSSITTAPTFTPISFTSEKFEQQVLAYKPTQREGVTDAQFAQATMILRENVRQTENDPTTFNRADYFNTLVAFLQLQEPTIHIDLALDKFLKSEGSCEYLQEFGKMMDAKVYDPIRTRWNEAKALCPTVKETISTPQEYAQAEGLKEGLLQEIAAISEQDGQYRAGQVDNWAAKQGPLDKQNQVQIDQLYKQHQQYLGKTLVGARFETTMWAVIQHAPIAYMEKYLPVLHQAFLAKELSEGPFRMFLDRYYGLRHGYQLFGSQSSGFGFELADEATRQKIEQQYGLK